MADATRTAMTQEKRALELWSLGFWPAVALVASSSIIKDWDIPYELGPAPTTFKVWHNSVMWVSVWAWLVVSTELEPEHNPFSHIRSSWNGSSKDVLLQAQQQCNRCRDDERYRYAFLIEARMRATRASAAIRDRLLKTIDVAILQLEYRHGS